MKGTKVGSYIIDHKIGEGGMGVVYAVKHDRMNRPAVVKMLRKQLASSPEMAKRFENEATAAASIGHPGIVQVFDIGQHSDGSLYIVMEHLRGESMQDRISRQGRLTVAQAIAFVRQAAGALGAAHALGIVHRDLKPDNIFIVPDPEVEGGERVKLLDFGIAKLSGDGAGGLQTKTGAMMGTPHYMSPEQCQGAGGVDSRSDIYALGCILFQLVAGRTPFVGNGAGDFIVAHMTQAPPSLRSFAPYAPAALEDVVMTLLAKNPAERFGSCEALVNALNHIPLPVSGMGDSAAAGLAATALGSANTAPASLGQVATTPTDVPTPPSSMQPPSTTMGLTAGESAHGIERAGAAGANSLPSASAPARRSSSKWALIGGLALLCIAGVSYGVVSRDAPTTPTPIASASEEELPETSSTPDLPAPEAVPLPIPEAVLSPPPASSNAAKGTESSGKLQSPHPPQNTKARHRDPKSVSTKQSKSAAPKKQSGTLASVFDDLDGASRDMAKASKDIENASKDAARATKEAEAARAARKEAPKPAIEQSASQPRSETSAAMSRKAMSEQLAPVLSQIQNCADRHNVHKKKVQATVTIGLDGGVDAVKIYPPSLGALATCMKTALRQIKLRPRLRTRKFTVPINLR